MDLGGDLVPGLDIFRGPGINVDIAMKKAILNFCTINKIFELLLVQCCQLFFPLKSEDFPKKGSWPKLPEP